MIQHRCRLAWGWIGLLAICLGLAGCGSSGDDQTGDSRTIYATIAGDNEVVVIDEGRGAITDHVAVGAGPAIILKTPDNAKLYTANWGDNTLSAIDVATLGVTAIAVAGRPYVIAMAPDGQRVYAGLYSTPRQIVAIDTASDTIATAFETPELVASLIVSADGQALYVATTGAGDPARANTLRAISATDGAAIHAPIAVGNTPAWITISPDGSRVYTLNYYSDDVSVVDTDAFAVVATVATGAGSGGIIGQVAPDGDRLYVTNHGTGDWSAIDTESNTLVGDPIALDGRPVGVTVNADGRRIYVAEYGAASLELPASSEFLATGIYSPTYGGQVSIFDAVAGLRIKAIAVGPGPTSLVVIED